MPHTFTNPVRYYLTKDSQVGDLLSDFTKIIDYLLTFVGDVGVTKESEGLAIISYSETPLKAILKTDRKQITLTCEKEDNLSVNLIKNVIGNIGYRIFNPQTRSYLVNDPNILDLTTVKVGDNILEIFRKYELTPFFQYRESLVFFAKDNKGKIHLTNRHLLEFLIENSQDKLYKKDFSVVVAPDIGRFIALFDRGLIPISFYNYLEGPQKIMNLSGFDIDELSGEVIFSLIFFQIDLGNQSFVQSEFANLPQRLELKKGESMVKKIDQLLKKTFTKGYLAIKIAQDIDFIKTDKKLIPRLSVSVFLDE